MLYVHIFFQILVEEEVLRIYWSQKMIPFMNFVWCEFSILIMIVFSKCTLQYTITDAYYVVCLPDAQPAHLISISFSSAHFKGEIFDYRQIEGNLCFCSMIGGIGGILHTWIADSSMQLLSDHNDLTNTVKFYSEPDVFERLAQNLWISRSFHN